MKIYRMKPMLAATFICAAAALSACGGKDEAPSESPQISSESPVETAETEATSEKAETYPGTVEATDSEGNVSGNFGIMHAKVLGVQPDNDEGIDIYSLQDKNDAENMWSIPGNRIGSIEADMSEGSEVAVAFKGDMINDFENVKFIAVIPEGNYLISSVTGTTVVNVMSTFSISTDDGKEMTFLKDNCEIEEDAMTGDSGERISVYYAQAADGTNYPLAVYSAD